jgi:tRNA pseudouridine13 synthase
MTEMDESNDPVKAIRAIPLQMRRFYVQAYQSFLFNRTISEAFEYGENLFDAQNDDVCFDKDAILGKFQNDESQKLAIPLVGHSYYKKTRFDFHIQKILFDEAVSTKDFLIKELQEASIDGGFRNAVLSCTDYSLNDNIVSFTLSRGSFATIVLREIMKPNEPLLAGF